MAKANYDLPEDKLQKVVKESGASSKREAIVIALDDYLAKKKAEALLKAYGKLPTTWTQSSLRKYRG